MRSSELTQQKREEDRAMVAPESSKGCPQTFSCFLMTRVSRELCKSKERMSERTPEHSTLLGQFPFPPQPGCCRTHRTPGRNQVWFCPRRGEWLSLDWALLQSCRTHPKSKTPKDQTICQELSCASKESSRTFIGMQKYAGAYKAKPRMPSIQSE